MKWFLALLAAGVFGAVHMGYIDVSKLGFGKEPGVQAFEDFYLLYARYDWDKANTFLVPGGPATFTAANKRRLAGIAGNMGFVGGDTRNIQLDITGKVANERGDRIEYEGVLVAIVDPQGSASAMGRPVTHDVRFTAVKRGEDWQIYSFSDQVRSSR